MDILSNCVLKNVNGFFTRLQDRNRRIDVSIYSAKKLTEGDISRIAEITNRDHRGERLTRKSDIQRFLVAAEGGKEYPPDYLVTHYSKYLHEDGRVSFSLAIGGSPKQFSFSTARAEFPNADYVVFGAWGCHERQINGWRIYTADNLSKSKLVILSCKTELLPDEIFMVMRGYAQAVSNNDSGTVITPDIINPEINKVAAITWTKDKIKLPVVTAMYDGSALLEITVLNDRNYFLAEI